MPPSHTHINTEARISNRAAAAQLPFYDLVPLSVLPDKSGTISESRRTENAPFFRDHRAGYLRCVSDSSNHRR